MLMLTLALLFIQLTALCEDYWGWGEKPLNFKLA